MYESSLMIINEQLAKSTGCDQKDLWATPPHIFNTLNDEFHFTLDPCCTKETAKCAKFYTSEEDGLTKSWRGESVFCNPPYSRGNIDLWVAKCFSEHVKGSNVVALLPVSSSSAWWHNFVLNVAHVRFYERRIKFVGAKDTAPFSSVVAIYGFGMTPQNFKSLNAKP
jgi:phage N-6-adenine-methyltransferase